MSYHRLLEHRRIGGRVRIPGSLIDYDGPPVDFLEPLDVAEHGPWLDYIRNDRPTRNRSTSVTRLAA